MNERIKQIAEKTGATILTTQGIEDVVDGCYIIGPARLQKFAELIIQECMDVVKDINQEYDGGSTVVNAAEEIKEHFKI